MVSSASATPRWPSAWWARRSAAERDGLLYAALVATGVVTWLLNGAVGGGGGRGTGTAQVAATLLGPVPVLLRRRYPVGALVAASAALLGVALLGLDSAVEITALAVVLVSSVAAEPRLRPVPVFLGAGTVVNVVSLLDARRLDQPVEVNTFVFGTFGCALAIGLGVVLRRHRAALVELAARNAELERARVAEARAAVADERVRIAREMHDVVAHHVSAILVRARAADHVRARRPEEVGPALTYVVGAAGETLTALRRLVGVLRAATAEDRDAGGRNAASRDGADRGDPVVEPPQPTLADLPDLVDGATGAGQPVTLRQAGHPRPAPADLQLTAYRVVQEALTNALRHAPGAAVTVELTWAPGSLDIRVGNGPGGPATVRRLGGGNGLVGMQERLAACGGSLAIGRTPAGGWEVAAGIPLPPEVGEPAGTERSGAA